ncbi:MAG: hypothetical protein UY47_C0003G0016 [Parcubacteria group bacterium GW2011_GWB1_49_7]|nr:MAG: hypothetical protein UX28_C0001G0010 [Candidatus Pacebacteria bacterium GW2011_GWA1_46_10]KKW09928.1 MAG: hypothetical protein UY47_C0003G0016 [Parcubacteria group bacterium GW2011_GWB1_49_7]HCR80943.1 hypothetical protein [Candidatus Paceibacterota bacterium]
MWRLRFPFFLLRLITTYLHTLSHATIFSLGLKRITFINIVLTLIILALSAWWQLLPNPQPQPTPKLPLNLSASDEVAPVPVTIETTKLPLTVQEYLQTSQSHDFHSQAEYLNLAILAQANQEYEKASQYLNLALYIDPNRDFFLK